MTDSLRRMNSDPKSILEAAARELLPVVVDLGPDQARFSSYVGAVRNDHGGTLVLEPLAAHALPDSLSRPLRITPAVGNAEWSVTASNIRRDGPHRACIDLSHASMNGRDEDEPAVAVQPSDLLVLVVPGGLHGGNSYVFPVQRIGAEVCEIRSNVALEPGRELEWVELVGDRRLLRRASAQVLETVPWYLADGSRCFASRLSLSEQAPANIDRAHDLVTDAAEVHRLLGLAGLMQAPGWFEAPGWSRGTLSFVEVRKDQAVFELNVLPRAQALSRGSVRIGVELFAVTYEFEVRVLALEGRQVSTSLPLILRRRRRHRREQRVAIDPSQRVELSFRNPVTGALQSQRLTEVSFFGVCFDFDPQTLVLWQGLPLEQAQLTWQNRLVHLGDLVVDDYWHDAATGRTSCVASISRSDVPDDPDMICLLATLAHPRVRLHTGRDFSALHQIYLKAGLFGPHMHRNLAPMLDQTADVWRRLHSSAADVARTFVHGPEDAPDAAATIVRAWEHAWVLQHVVDTSRELGGVTGQLQAAYLDHLVPRPDGRYLVFFIKTNNTIANAYLRRFFASTGTPDAVTRSIVEFWLRPAGPVSRELCPGDIQLRASDDADEVVIGRAVQRCLGPHAAAALSAAPGELMIPDTQSRFARAGLERSRRCSVVTRDGANLYAIVDERSTPGVNLTWMLNASWIFPIHAELDANHAGLDAALQAVVDQPAQSATGERFLNLPEGLDPTRLEAWGFQKEASLYLYVLTRAGLHRFLQFAANRYGELGARSANRERKRSH